MKRITRDHTLPGYRRTEVLPPVGEVELGESFIVETINFRTPIIRTPEDANPANYREREETGPVFIRGVEPGDVLAIHIEDIRPEGHASGGVADNPDTNSFLPIEDGKVHFPGDLWCPTHMMIGDICLLPDLPPDFDRTDTSPASKAWLGCDCGGNMDIRDICAGNTLYLKARREGGQLVLGDLHAAQGDGEIAGLGAECAGEVQLRVTKDDTYLSERPLIRKERSFVCIAQRTTIAMARDKVVEDAAEILTRLTGCTSGEASLYVGTVGHLRFGAYAYCFGRSEPEWFKTAPIVLGVEVPLHGEALARHQACAP